MYIASRWARNQSYTETSKAPTNLDHHQNEKRGNASNSTKQLQLLLVLATTPKNTTTASLQDKNILDLLKKTITKATNNP